jgi:hypothetical protein
MKRHFIVRRSWKSPSRNVGLAAAAGDVINVALSTNRRVELKSFQMCKALVSTTGAEAKPLSSLPV